jgi:hypothetical protein
MPPGTPRLVPLPLVVLLVALPLPSCVYITSDSAEGATTGASALAQCEATIQEIECAFPLELHITIHDGGCAVACEPPACPVNNILCINPVCSVCLPTTVELPLEHCQAFLQSCNPWDLGPTPTTSEGASSTSAADTESSTNSADAADSTEEPSVDDTAEAST